MLQAAADAPQRIDDSVSVAASVSEGGEALMDDEGEEDEEEGGQGADDMLVLQYIDNAVAKLIVNNGDQWVDADVVSDSTDWVFNMDCFSPLCLSFRLIQEILTW
jgi:hypothetical protein